MKLQITIPALLLLVTIGAKQTAFAERPKVSSDEAKKAVKLFDSGVKDLLKKHSALIDKYDNALIDEVGKRRDSLCKALKALRDEISSQDFDMAAELNEAIKYYKKYNPIPLGPDERLKQERARVSDLNFELDQLRVNVDRLKAENSPIAVIDFGRKGSHLGKVVLWEKNKILGGGSANWSLEDGKLVLRWPNSGAPDGAWVDTLKFLPDSNQKLAGTNQLGEIQLVAVVLGANKEWRRAVAKSRERGR